VSSFKLGKHVPVVDHAHCANRPHGGERAAQALWRHRTVHWLTEELIAQGHQITLFASGDSTTSGGLVASIPYALRLGRQKQDPCAAYAVLLADVAERASQFDVIHAHVDWVHLPLLQHLGVPFLTTLHGRLDLPGLDHVLRRFPTAPFVSISDNQRVGLPDLRWLGTVYHGLPKESPKPSYERGSYLAFLGRLSPEKGPDVAIRIARRAKMPLRIAAKLPRAHSRYFKEQLQPLIHDSGTELVGEINDRSKEGFLQGAAALLFPIDWPEPFGLVMIEAMACGTPVIAFRRGSVPELLDNGATGFVVENEDEAVVAVTRLGELDRRFIRAVFEERFTAERMAHDYLRHYRKLTRHTTHDVVVHPVQPSAL
jgi:glycosyltransferase involved in cell wall biosynthesis